MYILDTDHVSLYQRGHAVLAPRLVDLPPNQLATTIVTYEEQVAGRLAVLRRARTNDKRIRAYHWLQHTLDFYCRIPVLQFNRMADNTFQDLQKLRLRIGTQDLLIAAIALANDATLLTRNRRDFQQVPGLVMEDWTFL